MTVPNAGAERKRIDEATTLSPIDQRSLMFSTCISKLLSLKIVCVSVTLSVTSHSYLGSFTHTCFVIFSQVNSYQLSNNIITFLINNFSLLSCVMTSHCGLLNLGAGTSCFLNAILQCLFSCPLPLPRETQEGTFMRDFCALASRLRVQTDPLDASNIYYALPEVYRPGQQDASEVFHYLVTECPLLETFFTGIKTQTQNYSQCRPSNIQTTTFTSYDLHVEETTHAMGPVSLEQLIFDSTASETAIQCQVLLTNSWRTSSSNWINRST